MSKEKTQRTGETKRSSVEDGLLVQLQHQDFCRGGDVRPRLVGHAYLQAVGAPRGPFSDAQLARVLVQTEQPGEGGTEGERKREREREGER